MPNDYFHFKQFTIWQDQCAMKVGTDGVLLGAWANITNTKRILDVGTGTGLIAIMLAQRSSAHIDAIEIDKPAYMQASKNISDCPWHERIQVLQTSFQAYFKTKRQKYDLIVSNPPYFNNSLAAPDERRTIARHDYNFPFTEFIHGCMNHLNTNGKLSLIIPFPDMEEKISVSEKNGFFCSKKTLVYPTFSKPPIRCLLELSKSNSIIQENHLVIEHMGRHKYTPEYKTLTKDFYLAF